MSKTKEFGEAVDLVSLFPEESGGSAAPGTSSAAAADDNLSSVNIHIVRSGARLRGFARLDDNFLKPFFTRKFTDEVSSSLSLSVFLCCFCRYLFACL